MRSLRLILLAVSAALLLATSCSSQATSAAKNSPPPASAPAVKPSASTSASPLKTPHRQWLNLAYATVSPAEKLDLYLPIPRSGSKASPALVVYVHGGAWTPGLGDRADDFSLTVVNFFLSHGYAAASVDYRLSNEAHFPAQIEDVKTAVRWLRAHASQYGYDPGKIAALGDSAGGQLVALLGTSAGVTGLEGAQLGYPGVSSSVKAAIVLYPDVNFLSEETWLSEIPACTGKIANPNLPGSAASKYLGGPVQSVPGQARAADPMTYLTPGRQLPEFLIAQGNKDCIVPYQGAVEFYDALIKTGGSSAAQLIMERGEGHYPDFNYTELESPIVKLLRTTIGPGV
jgi:acetyl esterase/lipase